jgi:signal transduction histidine kinase
LQAPGSVSDAEVAALREEVERLRARLALLERPSGDARPDAAQFLAAASQQLAASLDYETILQSIARLAVPTLGDIAVIDAVDDDGTVERLGLAHADPAKEALLQEVQRRYPPTPGSPHPVTRALQSGQTELIPEIGDALLGVIAHGPDHLAAMRALDYRSALVVPLLARGRTLGAITFIMAGSGRQFGPADVALAEELARRCALAVDNARLYQRAQVAVRARDAFIALAAHELRTPLTALKGYGELMQRRGVYNARALDTMLDKARLLERLVNDLLDVSRLQTGRLRLQRGPVDLAAVARACAEQAATPDHPMRVHAPASLAGWWDEQRLEQVFQNLLGNAVKYTPAGGEVLVRLEAGPDEACVEIRDHGVGIAADVLPRLFDPFYRAETTAVAVQGLGLGLYISKALVAAHGGRMIVHSPGEGRGSTFSFTLPLATPDAEADAAPTLATLPDPAARP